MSDTCTCSSGLQNIPFEIVIFEYFCGDYAKTTVVIKSQNNWNKHPLLVLLSELEYDLSKNVCVKH